MDVSQEYVNVYPRYVDYFAVLIYLSKEIEEKPLNNEEIEGILEREFGITAETPEDVQSYVFSDLQKRFPTLSDCKLVVYYKFPSDLEKYDFRSTTPHPFA